MEKDLRIEITSLSWHLVWITAVCEALTVGLLPLFCDVSHYGRVAKSPVVGIVLGYVGMLTAILLFSMLARCIHSGPTSYSDFRVERPFLISIWGGIYLALIFALQEAFLVLPYHTSTIVLRAAVSLTAATTIILTCYRFIAARWHWLSVVFLFDRRAHLIQSVSIVPAAVFLAIYEALALPLIELISNFADIWFAGLVLGALAGMCGATVVTLLYAWISQGTPKLRMHICLRQNDLG